MYDLTVAERHENLPLESGNNHPGKRWERFIWPRWLPSRARLPLIAQITGVTLFIASLAMPNWSSLAPDPPPSGVAAAPTPAATPVEAAPAAAPAEPERPGHLNLDVRHNFRSVDFTVIVDDKRVLDTKLEGAGRKFGVFGKRGERSFTRSLDLKPGVRVVRLRVRSAADKFDHTRVERFDIGPAAVAAMRIGVDKSGLDVMTDRPPAPVAPAPAPVLASAAASTSVPGAAAMGATAANSAVVELYQTLRQLLIALAGFIASVASGFLFEEYLRSRNLTRFLPTSSPSTQFVSRAERRRRAREARHESDISVDAGLS